MSIIPGSQKYEIINQALAKSFNGSVKNNNVTQAGHIYDELIEDLDLEKNQIGKAGSVILMSSSLIHSAENYTKQKHRDVLILNYSKQTLNLEKNIFLNTKMKTKNFIHHLKTKNYLRDL